MAEKRVSIPDADFLKRTAATVRQVESQGIDLTGKGSSYRPRATAIPFRNMSGETIPPYAVMRVTGGGYDEFGNYLHNVAKPDAEERKAYLVNGRESVESGKRGGGHWLFGVDGQVLATGSADIDAVMGPSEGSWALQQEKLGFVVVGDTKTTSEDGMTVRAIQQFRVPDEDECDYIPKKWSDISGYVAGEIQMLVKLADSCPEWVTVGPCEEEESG